MGKNFLKMLSPHLENHDASTNPIINYFADRQHTEIILKDMAKKITTKSCFYGKVCENCRKHEIYRDEFEKQGFWTFNKQIKYWNIYDLDWSYRNKVFKLLPVRTPNFKV